MADSNLVEIRIVASGAQEAARVLEAVGKAGGQIGAITAAGARKAEEGLSSLSSAAKRVFEVFTGVSLANVFEQAIVKVHELTTEVIRLGREARVQEESFRLVAESVGASAEAMQEGIQHATQGLVNISDVLNTTSRAMQQGLAPEQIVALAELARKQAILAGKDVTTATNEITNAVATQQVRALKQYGIVIDLARAFENYAAKLGTTSAALTEAGQSEAVFIAVQESMKGKTIETTSAIIEQEKALQRFKVEVQETKENAGKNLVEMVFSVQEAFKNIGEAIANDSWVQKAKDTYFGFFTWLDEQSGHPRSVEMMDQGVPGTVGPGPRTLSAREIEDLRAEGATLDQIGDTAVKAQAKADPLKTTLFQVEQAMRALSAAHAQGTIGAKDYIGGLEQQLARLQALKSTLPDVKNKVLDLQTALAQARQESMAGVVGAMSGLATALDAASNTDFDQKMAAVNDALEKNEVLSAAAKEAIRAVAQEMVSATMVAEQMRDATREAMAILNAMGPPDLAQWSDFSKLWSDLGVKLSEIDDQFAQGGDQADKLSAKIAATNAALEAASARFGETTDDAAKLRERVTALADELERLKTVRATAETVAEAWSFVTKATSGAVMALGDWSSAMGKAEQEAAVLGKSIGDELADKIRLTEAALLKAKEAFGADSAEVRRLQDTLNGLKVQSVADELRNLGTMTELLGHNVDTTSATIGILERELDRLAKQARGGITPEMRELAATINNLIDRQKLEQALGLGRTMFDDFLDAGREAAGEMQRAWSDLFFDAFTFKLGEIDKIFTNFLQGLLRSLANFMANRMTQSFLQTLFGAPQQINPNSMAAFLSGGGGGGTTTTAEGNTVSVGVSSPEVLDAAGANATNSILGVAKGLTTLASSANNASTATSVINGVMAGWDAGFGGLTGAISGGVKALQTAAASASTFTVVMAGVGAAITVASRAMQLAQGNKTPGATIGGITGGVIGGVVGGIFLGPLGALGGIAIGDFIGGLIGGLFDHVGDYVKKRTKAIEDANAALAALTSGYQAGLRTGSASDLLHSLQATGADRGAVRTELVIPKNLAEQLGITGTQMGDQIRAAWTSVSEAQFALLIKAFKENPDLMKTAVVGSGDVGYLPGDQAQKVADQVRDAAANVLNAFVELDKVRDEIRKVGTNITDVARHIMPPDLADKFVHAIVDPITDRMLAAVSANLAPEEMQKQLEALQEELQGYLSILTTWGQMTQDIASLSMEFATQTDALVYGIETMMRSLDAAVEDAKSRLAEAVTTKEQAAAAQQLRQAILDRYHAEIDMVKKIEGAISELMDKVARPLSQTIADIAAYDIGKGDFSGISELLGGLQALATSSQPLAIRLFAISAGIAAVAESIGALGERLSQTLQGGLTGPDDIIASITAGAKPFLDDLAGEINRALNAHDLEGALTLLQQAATAIKSLGAAAIETINKWAEAQKKLATDQANLAKADINKNWDAFVEAIKSAAAEQEAVQQGIIDAAQLQIEANNASIKANEATIKANESTIKANNSTMHVNELTMKANTARITALQKEASALEKQLQAAEEWANQVKSARDYITGLKLSEGSPLSKQEQLDLVRTAYETARGLYMGSPSAERLAGLQQAAQQYLGLVGQQKGDVSGLTAKIIADLEDAVKRAPPDTTEVLRAQLSGINDEIAGIQAANEALQAANDELQEANYNLGQANEHLQDLIGGLNEANATLNDQIAKARDQIGIINKIKDQQIKDAEDARQRDLGFVDKWLEAEVKAIDQTKDTRIDIVKQGMANALRENAARQAQLLSSLVGQQNELLQALTGGLDTNTYIALKQQQAVSELQAANATLAGILSVLKQVTGAATGEWDTGRGGLRVLHPREMILPEGPATGIRRGGIAVPDNADLPSGRGGGAGAVTVEAAPVTIVLDGRAVGESMLSFVNRRATAGQASIDPNAVRKDPRRG